MKLVVKRNRELAPINSQNTQNENRAEIIELIVPEEYESFNKKIVFITSDGNVWDVIVNNEYKITNAITKYDKVDFYIWLTKEVDGESIDFRTKTKTLNFYHNEDASDEITDEEIHGVNTVVNLLEEEIEKVENLNIEATKVGNTTTVTITKKDGTTESVEINDGVDGQDGQDGQNGKDGQDGKDAKINGKNSIEIEAGNNITIDNTETGIRINSTNDGGTTDYTDLENKPKINNVELSGNKSLNDLGIQPKGNYIEDNNYVHTDNNFNNTYKNKLEGLENYDDTEIKADISDIQDEQTEQNTEIEKLQTENARLKATLPTTGEVTGQDITLDKTAELEFKKPPLPMGNSEQVQTTQSANLFDENYYNDDSLYTTGTYKYALTRIKGNRTLYVRAVLKDGKTAISGLYVAITTNGDNPNSGTSGYIINNGTNNTRQVDFTGLNNLYFSFYPTNTNLSVIFDTYNIMVSTDNVAYVPFVPDSPSPDYPQEITNVTGDVEVKVQNKNRAHDITYVSQTNQYYYLALVSYSAKKDKIYTISFDTENTGISCYLNLVDASKFEKITSNTNFTMDGQKHSFVVKAREDVKVSNLSLVARAQATSTTGSGYLSNFQIEEGSIATEYVEHKGQKFIFPLGNEKLMLGDYLADDGIHHVRGQVVFDGSNDESWNHEELSYGNNFYINIPNAKGGNEIPILSNYFKYNENGRLEPDYSCRISTSKNLNLRHQDFTNISDFKTWLSTHNTIVEYELAEETITPYTTAQQEVYNQIKQALSYEEQTNISSNQNALFNVEAYQDSKVILAEKYVKPSTGIPKTDLASDVQTSLGKADTAIQEHQDISGKVNTSQVKNSNSTTAGDVYDVRYINTMIGDVETVLTTLTTGSGV